MSAYEVERKKEQSEAKMSPVLDEIPMLCPYTILAAEDNKIYRELSLTNQEGKHFYATCLEYFVDLHNLEEEYSKMGYFLKYAMNEPKHAQTIVKIARQKVPPNLYYLSFTMTLIS
mmetsp:Transcript_35934/g.55197  ORF Transcript_35934/g.55197 Transcript_35934/m.55197 type:complete len:116 (-) Transcript_35934:3615-3962(-)